VKVLVTGANGMLGQDLCPLLKKSDCNVIETGTHNLNVTDAKAVENMLSEKRPDIVIHCAAYTNVDKAENDIETARLINKTGTKNLAKICGKNDIPIVYISTDYVFDGTIQKPLLPTDKTNPINIYGLTKLEGELEVQKYCKKYFITRTSWLYGIHGKNFIETMITLANKPELKVVNDQTGCPTWTVELANAIIKLIQTQDYGIYHICGSGYTTWYNFAKEIFKQLDLKTNLKPCTTDEFPRPAKRPTYSVMNNNNTCRDWKIGLSEYLKLRGK